VTTTRRPTPADPMPTAWPEDQRPSDVVRALPPELGPDAVAVLEGISFMYSNNKGDVPRDSIGGLVHEDAGASIDVGELLFGTGEAELHARPEPVKHGSRPG
jgi:hypothetical protein